MHCIMIAISTYVYVHDISRYVQSIYRGYKETARIALVDAINDKCANAQ